MAAEKKTGPMVIRTATGSEIVKYEMVVALTDLHDKARMCPWILPEEDSSHIAQNFIQAPKDHCCHETERPETPSKSHVDSYIDDVKGNECTTGPE